MEGFRLEQSLVVHFSFDFNGNFSMDTAEGEGFFFLNVKMTEPF